MRALVYRGNGELALEDLPVPVLQDERDAIVEVTLTTICSSDIHIRRGAVPRAVPGTILGHEFVGRVVQTGNAVKKVKPGDRVAVNVETFCGECFFCRRGYVNNCTDAHGGWALGCRIDGGQAEYVRIPFADNGLTVIPDSVTDEQALFVGDNSLHRVLGGQNRGNFPGGYGGGDRRRSYRALYHALCQTVHAGQDHRFGYR